MLILYLHTLFIHSFNIMFNIFTKKRAPEKLWFTTDLHSHLLPGIDDGCQDEATAVALVNRMKSWGYERLLITPHVTRSTYENTPETIDAAYERFKSALAGTGVDIDSGVSAEYRVDDLFAQQLEQNLVRPLPNDYILIENSFLREPPTIENVIFDLQLKGFRPVMAHPERFSYYWKNPSRLTHLHEAGALFQINLLSLSGMYGKEQRRMALELGDAGLVDFIGTDLHNLSGADSIEDYLSSKDYLADRKKLERRVRNDRAFV